MGGGGRCGGGGGGGGGASSRQPQQSTLPPSQPPVSSQPLGSAARGGGPPHQRGNGSNGHPTMPPRQAHQSGGGGGQGQRWGDEDGEDDPALAWALRESLRETPSTGHGNSVSGRQPEWREQQSSHHRDSHPPPQSQNGRDAGLSGMAMQSAGGGRSKNNKNQRKGKKAEEERQRQEAARANAEKQRAQALFEKAQLRQQQQAQAQQAQQQQRSGGGGRSNPYAQLDGVEEDEEVEVMMQHTTSAVSRRELLESSVRARDAEDYDEEEEEGEEDYTDAVDGVVEGGGGGGEEEEEEVAPPIDVTMRMKPASADGDTIRLSLYFTCAAPPERPTTSASSKAGGGVTEESIESKVSAAEEEAISTRFDAFLSKAMDLNVLSSGSADELTDRIARMKEASVRCSTMSNLIDGAEGEREEFVGLPIRELKRRCEQRGIGCAGFLEKDDFITALLVDLDLERSINTAGKGGSGGGSSSKKKKKKNKGGGGGGGGGGGLYEPSKEKYNAQFEMSTQSCRPSFSSGCQCVGTPCLDPYYNSSEPSVPLAGGGGAGGAAGGAAGGSPSKAKAVASKEGAPILDDLD